MIVHLVGEGDGVGRKNSAAWRRGEVRMVEWKDKETRWVFRRVDGGRWRRMDSRSSGVERTVWEGEGIV